MGRNEPSLKFACSLNVIALAANVLVLLSQTLSTFVGHQSSNTYNKKFEDIDINSKYMAAKMFFLTGSKMVTTPIKRYRFIYFTSKLCLGHPLQQCENLIPIGVRLSEL